ncbi:MAG: arginase family protein [Candidatus Krumholzibacteria bacterium]|nr:arginase family protein [Candidatus Krumholzibacteria bacterium]MDH4338532.1 arginase family protein [Candidatus Krumholzibacteria bacterium]MDH5269889.1 arginase family protein [Candidatus Krumholzibacteria bacterium]
MKPGFLEDKAEPGDVARDRNGYVLGLIPYEETTTYWKGVGKAPEAIVEASGHVELFDEVLATDASRQGILTVRPRITDLASVTAAARALREQHPDAFLGFIGGEHAITPALIEAVARPRMGIVWIDAHADLRKEFHGRPDNHACAGFNSMGFGPIVQVGIRTLAEEEYTLLKKTDRVRAHRAWGAKARADIMDLPHDVYLSVDYDGFSPEVIRAVGTPEPGGLYWEEVMEILDTLFRYKNVIAFDAVELCPQETDIASSFTAARLVYKVLNYHAYYAQNGKKKVGRRTPRKNRSGPKRARTPQLGSGRKAPHKSPPKTRSNRRTI